MQIDPAPLTNTEGHLKSRCEVTDDDAAEGCQQMEDNIMVVSKMRDEPGLNPQIMM